MIKQLFISRRCRLLNIMELSSAAIFFAAPFVLRNADCKYHYRQHSDFLYLTGFSEPEAILLIIKYKNALSKSILFNRTCDPVMENWFGRCLGQQDAITELGVDQALPFDKIDQQLYQLLNGLTVIYHAHGEFAYADQIVITALNRLKQQQSSHKKLKAPSKQLDWRPILHEMRLFKSSEELIFMRKSSEISVDAHLRAIQVCQPDIYEYQLAAEIEYQFAIKGVKSPAYLTMIGSGENSFILHYTKNDAVMKSGDLVIVDAGAEYQGYASDITRTYPVNGKFSKPQREIYNIVLQALNTALTLYQPGVTIYQVMMAAIKVKIEGLIKLGVLQGEIHKLIKSKAYLSFFMHSLSHWLGLDVHDVGNYGSNYDRPLEPGMVLTVEPGLYIASNANVPEVYRGIAIRIEDNIIITESGNENITAGVIKDPNEIEALMALKQIIK